METVLLNNDIINIVWLVLCTALVLLMQPGFTCFESGLVRSKNNINVALKNVADFCIAGCCFWLIGFGLMYGESLNGFIGQTGFLFFIDSEYGLLSFFLFQMMFCGTATTIVAGAVAERMRFSGYLICSIITSILVFPVIGHWVWKGANIVAENKGWLAELGFIDFAGGTVVHSVGGWLSLAGVIVLGPRLGRFSDSGKAQDIFGQNLPLSALGTFLLFFGWFGFNGGSLIYPDSRLALVFVNTALAGCAGGVAALVFSWKLHSMKGIHYTLNGLLAGLVSITASANLVAPSQAAIIGFMGGLLSVAVSGLLVKNKIDDVVDAIPVHLGGGIWGTLAVSLFAPLSIFEGLTRPEQFGVQLFGIVVCGSWAFGLGYGLLTLINRFYPLRVSPQTETIGLNFGEHGMKDELIELMAQMDNMKEHKDFDRGFSVERGSENAFLSITYNHLLETVNAEYKEREKALLQLANLDPLTGIANRRLFDEQFEKEWSKNQREGTGLGLLLIDVDEFKKYNDHYGHQLGDYCLQNICKALSDQLNRAGDILARVGGEEFAVILPSTNPGSLERMAEILRHAVEKMAIPHNEATWSKVTISIGIGYITMAADMDKEDLFSQADQALYQAKSLGRNKVMLYQDIRDAM